MIIRFCFLIFQTIFALKIFLSQFQYLWIKTNKTDNPVKLFLSNRGVICRVHITNDNFYYVN